MKEYRQDLSEAGRCLGPLAEIIRQAKAGELTPEQLQAFAEHRNPFEKVTETDAVLSQASPMPVIFEPTMIFEIMFEGVEGKGKDKIGSLVVEPNGLASFTLSSDYQVLPQKWMLEKEYDALSGMMSRKRRLSPEILSSLKKFFEKNQTEFYVGDFRKRRKDGFEQNFISNNIP